ncbi:transcription-repair coupling factor [Luteibaculum oceani]|uniref:Transcription-repair-coupling factor n=1 Tax=Luteibaculum oceani TaxID=1294296 RepID=A0A5C6V8T3_9FLAO|nr:transcription-repair coupling factor [Luteibaculum oceani]TXC81832.1 transcription-repair coupling factor [Luteibaculum oceani]
MQVNDLLGKFILHPKTELINRKIGERGIHLGLKGLVGSGAAMVAQATIRSSNKNHVFVLNDKEEAAYFLNDLENTDPDLKPLFFPDSSKLAYEELVTDNANVLMRAQVLSRIASGKPFTIVSYPQALAEKVVSKKKLSQNTLALSVGESYDTDFINEFLLGFGFERVDYVYEPGQFSIRGGIIDIYSFAKEDPYRIELFGDEVESIRFFDPGDQRSVRKVKKATIVPNVQSEKLSEIRESFLDFIPEETVLWIKSTELCIGKIEKSLELVQKQFEKLEGETKRLLPAEINVTGEEFAKGVVKFTTLEFGLNHPMAKETIVFNQKPQPSFNKNFDLLDGHFQKRAEQAFDNVIVCSNSKQVERLYRIFEDQQKEINFTPIPLGLAEGFEDEDINLVCFTDHQIFERYNRFRLKEGFKKNQQALTLKEISQLEPGDYVTHIDHGIGKFSGLETIDVDGKKQEAIRLVYRDNDILYVSIHSLHRISKYTGKEGNVPKVNKLGSQAWQNLKSKTKKKVKEIAFDLIKLYAKRKAAKGFAYAPDTYLQNELEASFIYEDTPDQLKATQDVKADMESEMPMDRLVCGDVGFGKTEIAIRAAFKAITDGKQVAVMVPTTVLSLQHYKSFKARMADFPCRVDYVNRFKTTKQNKDTLKDVADGKIDILIGTHRIISKDVKFKDLGLLILDEEQKFGVAVKDKLKTLRANIDCLTLTATPIPRTLQFSLMGARDLSIINTPPPNRYPVSTELIPFSEERIRDAITYEVSRGGQVFFVHNRVQNIMEVAGMIKRLCPGVNVGVGHGQMDGTKLEKVMVDFTDGLFDVLVATTIIESGIDITNANTILVNNAQNFGLSDLHQLRGRVGRSNKKAFCYLIAPPLHALPDDSRKRLQALVQFSDLGSGMSIAMRDLDIRGAGDLLGGEQSGFINDMGFETYKKILDEAVRELKETEFKDLFEKENKAKAANPIEECVIETDLQLLIPDWYVNNITERLSLYKELDDIEDEDTLKQFEEQLKDRFGDIPEESMELLDTLRLRWLGKDIGFERLKIKSGKMLGYFIADKDSMYFQSEAFTKILQFVASGKNCKLKEKNGKLYMIFEGINTVKKALNALAPLQVEALV